MTYYELRRELLKDSENMICVIGGVDYMAGVRSNLGE